MACICGQHYLLDDIVLNQSRHVFRLTTSGHANTALRSPQDPWEVRETPTDSMVAKPLFFMF